ncbi:DUF2848 family protein [Rhizobium skierniewicense]|uniref:DUF2848 family protein n=1 Tax=Rhizobium skierniewicense TaxID=984260 RepID=UPI001571AE1A|nr:DUF2848 family protein [Rhizobium skierniewicense]
MASAKPDAVQTVDDIFIAAACHCTGRELEVHEVSWSKQSFPDMIGDVVWRYAGAEATLTSGLNSSRLERRVQNDTTSHLPSPPPDQSVSEWLDCSVLTSS